MYEHYSITEQVYDTIKEVKRDLAYAVSRLEIHEGSVSYPESFLDFGILISLYYLYMYFIERALTKERKMSKNEERCFCSDSWKLFQKRTKGKFDPKVAITLDLLRKFEKH